MTTWQRGSSEVLRSALTAMRDHQWSWRTGDVDDLCRRMGWTLHEVVEGRAASGDAGLGVAKNEITMMFKDGLVEYIDLQVTDIVRESGTARDRFMRDVFAETTAEGKAVLGEPENRQRPQPPTVRWRLDESTVLIKYLESTVQVTWARNGFQDEWDGIAEALE